MSSITFTIVDIDKATHCVSVTYSVDGVDYLNNIHGLNRAEEYEEENSETGELERNTRQVLIDLDNAEEVLAAVGEYGTRHYTAKPQLSPDVAALLDQTHEIGGL